MNKFKEFWKGQAAKKISPNELENFAIDLRDKKVDETTAIANMMAVGATRAEAERLVSFYW